MSAKTSMARRDAFFAALGETGNQTLAAERAKVSRSWVSLHRATDPAFKARMDSAIAEAKARLRGAAGVQPLAGWQTLAGEELTVRGSNGRRTQIARARLKQWTPRIEARFLAALAGSCNVKVACAAVGLTAASAYGHRERWTGFAERWDRALATGYIRLETAMVEAAGTMLGGPEEARSCPPELPLTGMSFDGGLQLLRLHQRRVHAVGCRPGRVAKRLDFKTEIEPAILKQIERVTRVSAQKAARAAARLAARSSE